MCTIKKSSEPTYASFCLKLSSKEWIKLAQTWQFHIPISLVSLFPACWAEHAGQREKSLLHWPEHSFLTASVSLVLNVQTEELTGTGKAVIILI